nr:uncharacterized protein LOC109162703 [Ipomoea batatas]
MDPNHVLSEAHTNNCVTKTSPVEDQDAIERNSKKSKTNPKGTEGVLMEEEATPMEVEAEKNVAGAKLSYKETLTGPPQNFTATKEDSSADATGTTTNDKGAQNTATLVRHESRPELTEKYGAWMLAPKRYNRRNYSPREMSNFKNVKNTTGAHTFNGSKVAVGKYQGSQPSLKDASTQGFISESRYNILSVEEFEEPTGNTEIPKEHSNATNKGKGKELASVSVGKKNSKGKGKRQAVQISEKQVFNESRMEKSFVPAKPQNLAGSNNRASSSRGQTYPNRAAAEDTHTVVRGSKNDTSTVSKIFHSRVSGLHDQALLDSGPLAHHDDPISNDPMEEEPWHECSDGELRSGTPEGVPS